MGRGLAGDVVIGLRQRAARLGHDSRPAAIGLLPNTQVQRQAAKERHTVLSCHALATACAKDGFLVAATRANMRAHVLDDPQHRNRDLFEHAQRLASIQQRDILRGGHDQRAAEGHLLAERQLHIARSRRQIDDEVIDSAPVGVAQKLGQRLRHHRPPPDHRLILVHQIAHRHGAQTMAHDGRQPPVWTRLGRAAHIAQHARLTGAVQVGVQQADARAIGRERQGQVHGGGRFAHAALAGGDCQYPADIRYGLPSGVLGRLFQHPARLDPNRHTGQRASQMILG